MTIYYPCQLDHELITPICIDYSCYTHQPYLRRSFWLVVVTHITLFNGYRSDDQRMGGF